MDGLMTTREQEIRSIEMTKDFLYSLLNPKKTPRTPKAIRNEARKCLRHYPLSPCLVWIDNCVNAQVRKERDEARRLHCRMSAQFLYKSVAIETAEHIADGKGWDCFKSDTLSQEESEDVTLLKGLKQAKEGKFSKAPPQIT